MKKAEIYKQYGIEYKGGKILSPMGWINPLLVNGNSKLGRGVWTFSTLAGNMMYTIKTKTEVFEVKGTCPCNCKGCYAQTGFYRMSSVLESLGVKTAIARCFTRFMRDAIVAQIKAEGISLCRIHASGDFFTDNLTNNMQYINAWKDIAKACESCVFWSYTKNPIAEDAFKGIPNINIVRSVVHGFGFNFGRCAYILRVYKALQDMGKDVYICRCGIDKNQHCTNCKGCSKNEYVLFIEHSTDYKAEQDPLFPVLRDLIESQDKRRA